MTPASTATETLMVVDGEVLVRTELAQYLRGCGYTVIEAGTTDEVKTVLAAPGITVDVILCDADAPGEMNGFGLASWIRGQKLDIQVVLAGSVEKAAKAAAELCDDGPHLARPYDHRAVSDFIRQGLARRDRSRSQIRAEAT